MATVRVFAEDPDDQHSWSHSRGKPSVSASKKGSDSRYKSSSGSIERSSSSSPGSSFSSSKQTSSIFKKPSKSSDLSDSDGSSSSSESDSIQSENSLGAASIGSSALELSEEVSSQLDLDSASVSTLEDGSVSKGTSYYLKHQRFIDNTQQIPIAQVCDPKTSPLSPLILNNLSKMGLENLFPVQAEVIPFILRGVVWGGDVCVCAPTGSGKTLAYVIPIVQTLQSRVVQRLRALVLVPTHDLVVQVSQVFEKMIQGSDLVVEALYGNKGFKGEQRRLVRSNDPKNLEGGSSKVDIVVSTPGRLIDHLQETPGFTLQHLQFLVVDEADRLLMSSFQDWLPKVLEAVHSSHKGKILKDEAEIKDQKKDQTNHEANENEKFYTATIDAVTSRSSFLNVAVMESQQTQLQKLLFSATLTQNPEKIASLRLVNPQYFTATTSGKSYLYTIPTTLEQNITVCTEQHKPLLLLHLLTKFKDTQILCFVRSIDTAHRLSLLLKLMNAESYINGLPIYEYSSSLTQPERNAIMLKFKNGNNGVIICSDVMARGLDIKNVGLVINYDIPDHVKTYVHRVGRTGRAGRKGISWTISVKEDVKFFYRSLSKAENSSQNYVPLPYEDIKKYFTIYKEALRQLNIEMEREKGSSATKASSNVSFALNLDTNNQSDKKTIRNSLKVQVATAWFNEEGKSLISPEKIAHVSATANPNSEAAIAENARRQQREEEKKAKKKERAKEKIEEGSKKKRRRRKKNELESLSLSSSDESSDESSDSSSSSDSSESSSSSSSSSVEKPKKTSKGEKDTKESKNKSYKKSDKMEVDDSKSKQESNEKKKKRKGQLDSLSLSSTSSDSDSDSDSSEKPKTKKSKQSSSKAQPEKSSKKRKNQLESLSLSSTSSDSDSDSSVKPKTKKSSKKDSSKAEKSSKKRKRNQVESLSLSSTTSSSSSSSDSSVLSGSEDDSKKSSKKRKDKSSKKKKSKSKDGKSPAKKKSKKS